MLYFYFMLYFTFAYTSIVLFIFLYFSHEVFVMYRCCSGFGMCFSLYFFFFIALYFLHDSFSCKRVLRFSFLQSFAHCKSSSADLTCRGRPLTTFICYFSPVYFTIVRFVSYYLSPRNSNPSCQILSSTFSPFLCVLSNLPPIFFSFIHLFSLPTSVTFFFRLLTIFFFFFCVLSFSPFLGSPSS